MKPAVLLVPGVLCNEAVWRPVIDILGAQADVRLSIPVKATIAEMAESAWDTLAGLSPEVPLILAGFSLGGFVVLEMLARTRRPVHGVAFVSTSARPETPEGAVVRDKTIAALGKDFGRAVDGIIQYASPAASPELVVDLRRMMHEVGPEIAIRQNLAARARADHRPALSGMDFPVAVLCGAGDRVTPPDRSREMAELIPGASLELVEGAGHMLPREHPEIVARALRALLAARECRA